MKPLDREAPSDEVPVATAKPRGLIWLIPLILCPAMLVGCWNAPFSLHDDIRGIKENALLSADVAWTECFAPHPEHYFYYPLTLLSWRFDRFVSAPVLAMISGDHAWAASIRTGNLILHVLCALFLWLIAKRLGASPPLAAFVAIAFALHPTACESVCWAIERKSVLAGALGFLALWQYMRTRSIPGHALGILAYSGALLAKPSALGIFPILVVWELLGRPELQSKESPGSDKPANWPRAVGRLAAWTVPTAAATLISFTAHASNVLPPPGGSLFTALLTDVVILFRYVVNFISPHALSAYYAVEPVTSLIDGRLWLCSLASCVLVSGTLWLAGRSGRRVCLFGWLWMLAALGPHLNLVSVGDLMHDRYAYLAAPGMWLALGVAARGLCERFVFLRANSTRYASAGVLVAALAWTMLSFQRGYLFADTSELFTDAVRKQPQSSWAHVFLAGDMERLAVAAEARGDQVSARSHRLQRYMHLDAATKSVDFDRCIHQPRANAELAALCYERKEWPKARAAAEAALKPPKGMRVYYDVLSKSHLLLGLLALREQNYEEARSRFEKAAEYEPERLGINLHRARSLMGIAANHQKKGDKEAAKRCRDEARTCLLKIPKGHPAHGEAQVALKQMIQSGDTGTGTE